MKANIAKHFSLMLGVGSFVVTVILFTGINTDPVNATKFFALGAFGISLLFLILKFGSKTLWHEYRIPFLVIAFFCIGIIISTVMSSAPMVQNVYGSYGRNTGALTYFFLACFFLTALLLNTPNQVNRVIVAFLASGFLNIAYCGWVLAFGDFIGWENPYGNILGLFGITDCP